VRDTRSLDGCTLPEDKDERHACSGIQIMNQTFRRVD